MKLLELLVCPLTKGPLAWDAERCELVSGLAKLAYPVRDGIPVMLPSEARSIDDDGNRHRKNSALMLWANRAMAAGGA